MKKWEGVFSHLMNDAKIRMERIKDIEAKLKLEKEKDAVEEPKAYKILKRSNQILRDKLLNDYWEACYEVTKSSDHETEIRFIDYVRLLELLGYAHEINDTVSKLIEDLWMHLSTPNTDPDFLDEDSGKLNLKRLFNFLCIMHRFTNQDNKIVNIRADIEEDAEKRLDISTRIIRLHHDHNDNEIVSQADHTHPLV